MKPTTPPITVHAPSADNSAEGPPRERVVAVPHDPAAWAVVRDWLHHLEAGRIGTRPECSAEAARRMRANERLFASLKS